MRKPSYILVFSGPLLVDKPFEIPGEATGRSGASSVSEIPSRAP
jgi:hypothetical protein